MIREIYGKKIGMTQIFDDQGNLHGVTLVEVEPVCILEKITYNSKQVAKIGCFKLQEHRVSKLKKPVLGYFNKLGLKPYYLIKEVELVKDADLSFLDQKAEAANVQPEAATAEAENQTAEAKPAENNTVKDPRQVGLEIFAEGEVVDVRGRIKGRGFTGGMKRHNWHGGPSAHGSMTHRRIGSNGCNTYPGRVLRGHRMPGHYGNSFQTIRNVKILKIDSEKNILFIKGAVPGFRGSVVKVKKLCQK